MKNTHSKIFHNRSLPHTIHATDAFRRDDVDVRSSVSSVTSLIDIHVNSIVSLGHDIANLLPGHISTSTTTSGHESDSRTRISVSSSPSFTSVSQPSSSFPSSSHSDTGISVPPTSTASVSSDLGNEVSNNGPSITFFSASASSSGSFIPSGSFMTRLGIPNSQISGSLGVSNSGTSATPTSPNGSNADGSHTDNDLQSPSVTGTGTSGGDAPTNQESDNKHGELSPGVISAIILAILFSILVAVIFLCRRRRQHRRDQATLGWRSGGSAQRDNRDSLSESFHRTIPSTGSTRSRTSSFSDRSSIYSSPPMSERTAESDPVSYHSMGGSIQFPIRIAPRPLDLDYTDQPLETSAKDPFMNAHSPPLSPSGERVQLIRAPLSPTPSEYESGSSSTRLNRSGNHSVITTSYYRPLTGKIPPIPPLPSSPPPVPGGAIFGDRTNPFSDPTTG